VHHILISIRKAAIVLYRRVCAHAGRQCEMDRHEGGLSAAALKRAAILAAIAKFHDGAFGQKRLQKVIYRASRQSKKKPFRYRFWDYGQYSGDVSSILKDLSTDGLIQITPLDGNTGNRFSLTAAGWRLTACLAPVERVLPGYSAGLRQAMQSIGYMKDSEINRWAKAQPEVQGKAHGYELFDENLEQLTNVPDLTEEEAEDLEIALCTCFLQSAEQVINTLKHSPADLLPLHNWNGSTSVSTPGPR